MECNKDEAIKAREIAVKKMESKDFVGAKKFVLKAQQLYSDLGNIPQMLTICNVHCSAEQKVLGTDMDWYSILQTELTADEASIKKQYRKLALLLHPDKNKMAGAEAAFKLIGEAHRVLSDQLKRSVYDMKYKGFKERPAFQQQRQNSTFPVKSSTAANNTFGNIPRPQFTSVNLHGGQNQPGVDRPTFWTNCPFCNTKYQYYRDLLNRALRCQQCLRPYIAYDLNVQGVPVGANCTPPPVPQPKQSSQEIHNRVNAAVEAFQNKMGTSKVNRGPKKKVERGGASETARKENKKVTKPSPETRSAGRKRKKQAAESSGSCDTEASNGSEFEIPEDKEGGTSVEKNSKIPEGRNTRRSTRQKPQVIYNEDNDDDVVGNCKKNKPSTTIKDESLNKSNINKSDDFASDVKKERDLKKPEKNAPFKESSCNGTVQAEKPKENGKEPDIYEDSEDDSIVSPEPQCFEVPDPDLYVFDNDRKEDCFATGQMWAIYDTLDGMPRFYAQIKKVLSPGFKVQIRWLEAKPDDQNEIAWVNQDLPVSCGLFKYDKTETTKDINMFSHIVTFEKVSDKGLCGIYPRKGEIWAIFKHWSIKWSSEPDENRSYEFDFVEILSDYEERSGTSVAYLEKLKGFVSLYKRREGVASFQIPPKERLRFSHMVPSYRATGKERDGVPEGSFELDPASLPANALN